MSIKIGSGKNALTIGHSLKGKVHNSIEEKTSRVTKKSRDNKIALSNTSQGEKGGQNLRRPLLESQITIEKMTSKKFEGWRIKLDSKSCGWIKFFPNFDNYFKDHATIDFAVPQPQRGRHIGRFALKKALDASIYLTFVAYLRKGNFASKKVLSAVGFQETSLPKLKQLCMFFKKES